MCTSTMHIYSSALRAKGAHGLITGFSSFCLFLVALHLLAGPFLPNTCNHLVRFLLLVIPFVKACSTSLSFYILTTSFSVLSLYSSWMAVRVHTAPSAPHLIFSSRDLQLPFFHILFFNYYLVNHLYF